MNRADILAEAKRLTTQDREQEHGDPHEQFARVAQVWGALLGVSIEPYQVPLMMAGLKMIRATGGRRNADDFYDLTGYAALSGEVAMRQGE